MSERAIVSDEVAARYPAKVTVNEFAEISRLSRRTIFKLMHLGQLQSEFSDGRRLIVMASYFEMLNAQDGQRPAPMPQFRKGFIYFIGSEDGRVKIGYSTKPGKRLRAVQTGASTLLRLIAAVRGSPQDEQQLHAKFVDYRLRGEWFRFEGELRTYVEELTDG
jgi:Meiotically Up-regulated Gene 113 (MUG113) protein